MSGPPREAGDEFADYVRARQEQLLRAAYLVCGDLALADEVTQDAFGALLLRWRRMRDDDPDTFVRREAYRAATVRRVRRREGSGSGPDLPPGLAALTRRQRAVAVLLRYEERGEVEAAEVLGLSVASLRRQLPAVTRDDLLDAASPVPDRDYVDRARLGALGRRRHAWRRWAGTVAAGAVLVGAVIALPDGSGRSVAPAPSATPSASGASATSRWDGSAFALLGTVAQVGPSEEQVSLLPTVDDLTRGQLALPEVLSFGPRTRMRTLSELGPSSAPVRAVLLRHESDGFRAVLVRPTLEDQFVVVDTLPLVPNVDEAGRASPPLEVTAVAEDRRHVLFLQPGRVVVLDAYSGEVRTHPVADRYLDHGGWTPTSVIAWSETARWRIDRRTGQVTRLSQSSHLGPHRVTVEAGDEVRVHTFDVNGSNQATRGGPGVLSGTWGTTLTSPSGRVATGGFLGRDAALAANQRRPERLFQGVLALPGEGTATDEGSVEATDGSAPRLLVAPLSEGVSVGCCEVLGWAYNDQVLVRWRTTHLLSWNASTGSLVRVSTLPGRGGSAPGTAAVSVAIAP
ncbi:RNA polymerase subunit sigma-70 [Knoellia flava TL1]|uniref:RNA polymerase sigma-70 region 2 domain-containing protein n=2 Tax=Knoellia flava TaxID=913969 RepID=A0A8H9FRC6_9MICO|nr:hypothetical protein [Knoellia flava]KGN35431.1 RNA polymerase subunit sigma-70 [Knoellia flava TL1]GGB69149.1 hypothetical protein GCM10011314_05540 [Knoellia flava]